MTTNSMSAWELPVAGSGVSRGSVERDQSPITTRGPSHLSLYEV